MAASDLAGSVTVSREAFARAFDAVAASRTPDRYLDFKMVALGSSGDAGALSAAFARAERDGFLGDLVAYLAELGHLDLSKPGLTPQDAAGLAFSPQGMTPAMMNMLNAAAMLQGFTKATRCTCLVEIDRIGVGTGFLVGPQTVLTNWHVVHGLIDPATGTAVEGSAARLACVFDFTGPLPQARHVAVEDWLVEWSPLAATPVLSGQYPDMTGLKPHALDFCVMRVVGAPGRMRTWYDLGKAAAVPAATQPGAQARPAFVVQHPAGLVQRIAVTDALMANPADPAQVFHMAPTVKGSSGGLCLNAQFNLVALHQGEQTQNGVFVRNVGISARAIAAAAPGAAGLLPQYDLLWRLRDRKAVIGRRETIDQSLAMNDPATPISFLIIRGAAQSGKSFTRELIENRLEYRSRFVVPLDGGALPVTGRELAAAILTAIGCTDAQALPQAAGSGTTPPAFYRGEFMSIFNTLVRKTLQADHAGRTPLIWLVVDRLGEETATPTDARNFLEALFAAAPPEFRFVLLGLTGSLLEVDPGKVDYEDLPDPRAPVKAEIVTYLQCLFADRNIAAQAEEFERLAGLALATARDLPEDGRPLLARLGALLTRTFNSAWD